MDDQRQYDTLSAREQILATLACLQEPLSFEGVLTFSGIRVAIDPSEISGIAEDIAPFQLTRINEHSTPETVFWVSEEDKAGVLKGLRVDPASVHLSISTVIEEILQREGLTSVHDEHSERVKKPFWRRLFPHGTKER